MDRHMSEAVNVTRTAYVLDDEPGVRFVACHILKASGFAPREFAEAQPFLKAVYENPPDTVIVDLSLGNSDAVEVIRQLATMPFRGKVMLFSGKDENTLQEISGIGKSRGLAMLPPLRKPFRAPDFKRCLFAEPEVSAIKRETREPLPEIDLLEVLRNNWMELWYQPKIDLRTGLIVGAEGLVRARHPAYGLVPPSAFIPPPDDPRHEELARFVFGRALSDWTQFAAAGLRIRLSVNVPVPMLYTPGFAAMVRGMLPDHPKFPGFIIEITEDEAIRDAFLVNEVAAQLKLSNIWLSVDDFGAAYSSLSRLLDLSCVELKLDRSFITGCSSDDLKREICRTVIDLAGKCGVSVCAEGIETAADLGALVAAGCPVGQGYLFARPMELRDLLGGIEKITCKAQMELSKRSVAYPKISKLS
jgi:EAL domain-containing protein (putative c-di-GMP-specific phosphodiesterase class I)